MSDKQLNPGMLSAARGGEIITFGFRTSIGTNPSSLWQLGANAIASVTWVSSGLFTVTFNDACPRMIAACHCDVQSAVATVSEIGDARMVLDSLDLDAKTFQIFTFTDDGDGTLTVEDLTDDTVITCTLTVQRINALVESQA